jgi:hypothetical protein
MKKHNQSTLASVEMRSILVLTVIFLWLPFLCSLAMLSVENSSENWPAVVGKITKVSASSDFWRNAFLTGRRYSSPHIHYYEGAATFEYSVAGRNYSGHTDFVDFRSLAAAQARMSAFHVGDSVVVYHCAPIPQWATIAPGSASPTYLLMCQTFGILGIFFPVLFFIRVSSRGRRAEALEQEEEDRRALMYKAYDRIDHRSDNSSGEPGSAGHSHVVETYDPIPGAQHRSIDLDR